MNNAGSEQSTDHAAEKGLPRFIKRRKGELLLRSVPEGTSQLLWAWLARQPGQPDQMGFGKIPEPVRTLPATLVLGATDYAVFDVSAPPGLKESEYPLLLEDQLMGDVSAQHLSCIGRQHGRLQLVACAREKLESWQHCAQQAGIRLNAIVTDFQRLADPDSGVLLWRQQGAITLIKPSLPDQAGGVLSWPDTELPPLPQSWQPDTVRSAGDIRAELTQLADLAGAEETSLLPRKRGSRSALERPNGYTALLTRLFPLWRSLRIPLAALVLSLGCFGLAAAGQNWTTQSSYRVAVTERLGLPEGASENRVRRELRRRLNQQSEPLLRLDDASLLYRQLDAWLQQTSGWQLQHLEMQTQTPRIVLSWQGTGAAVLPEPEPQWASLASLEWQRVQDSVTPLYELTLNGEEKPL